MVIIIVNDLRKQQHDLIRSFDKKEITESVFNERMKDIQRKIDKGTENIINDKNKQFEVKKMVTDEIQEYVGDDMLLLLKTLENNIIIRLKKELVQQERGKPVKKRITPVDDEDNEETPPSHSVDKKSSKDGDEKKPPSRTQAILDALLDPKLNTKNLVIENVEKQRPQDFRQKIISHISVVLSCVKTKKPMFNQYEWDETNYLLTVRK